MAGDRVPGKIIHPRDRSGKSSTTAKWRFAGLLLVAIPASSLLAEELKIGTAVVDITPPVPYRMSGYFSERLSTGIKDRLSAKTIVLVQGKTQGAIVFCDLIGISPKVSSKVRSTAEKKHGIPASNISIMATHSHTGPLYFGALRKHFHDRIVKSTGSDPHEAIDYPEQLTTQLVDSIGKALANTQPARLQAGIAKEKRLSFNRRFHMKGGGVRFNPGQQNPDILRVAGPIDPEVGIISFSRLNQTNPFAALVSFALHLDTVGGSEYSADYPKHLQDRLREKNGKEFVSFFGAGTCGDINHIDIKIKGRRTAKEIGSLLAETVLSKFPTLEPVDHPALAILSTRFAAPLQTFSQQETQLAIRNMHWVDSSKLSFLERVQAYKITAIGLRIGDSIPLEVHGFRLSKKIAIVTLPGEVFVDIGIAIKTASPFETTIVMELANDAPGYIPTRKAFAEGSYETVNSRVQPGNGEKMATEAIRLLQKLFEL
ncbi:MAG: neutral/alkaline non-lysosomal ceramidase N-terminal domain-containing protein [Planctomycetota bacterium]|nr:neutral/alkaline non-lysosomal ceramidase N-terminal domain-containing protein [Planctomycetota bacterium]